MTTAPAISPTTQAPRSERIPPQDLDAEMALLGSMMMSRDVIGEVLPIIGRSDSTWFYLPAHQKLFEVLIDMYDDPGKAIDLIVVSDELRRRDLLDFIGGQEYMIQLAESFAEWANAEHYAKIVRDKGMLRDLLDCSTVSAKGEPFEPADLSAPLEWALLNLRFLIEESHARVTSDPLPIVSCDAPQLARVFQNLLENAMKYRGMETPRIHVSSQTVGDEIVVSVCDNGMGIDPAQHEAIFEMFRRGSGATGPGNVVVLSL